jgi:UDP-N-acetylmuramoyl-tripeptide--D-alanyl-D-alanine ligase
MLTPDQIMHCAKSRGWTLMGPTPDHLGGVGTDTRARLDGQLFVALVGERFDAHEYIERAVDGGAVALLVQRLHSARLARRFPGTWVIGVEDTLYALGTLAQRCRLDDPRKVLAITGSAGKTSARLAAVQAAGAAGYTVHTPPGNENNRIGVPRFLVNLPPPGPVGELVVVECGTSEPGEIARLGAICRPDAALVTSVCAAHTEQLIDEDGVAHEKGDLLRAAWCHDGIAVCDDDPRLRRAVAQGNRRWFAPLTDRVSGHDFAGAAAHLVANAAKVLAALEGLGITLDSTVVAAARLDPPPGRGGVVAIGDRQVMDDTYNANELSMLAALDAAAGQRGDRPLVCFLGEMRELGEHAETAHRKVAEYAAQTGAKTLIFTGPYAVLSASAAEAAGALEVYAAADAADWEGKVGDLPVDAFILIKGSRGARMERLVEALHASEGAD